ncbi:MAG: 3-isopropylmalate dehydratase small subunit [Betaproteobacteria bacterium]
MDKFGTLTATAAAYPAVNVDTDLIIRVERCAGTPRAELGPWAFEMVRYQPDGSENPEFVFNREPWRAAKILVAGENFGTGSSREMAVWALAGMGIRCVIAPSFGDIFFGNCFQNGLLAIRLPGAEVGKLMALASDPATATFTVDLERQAINGRVAFEISPRRKRMLLEGLDELGLTLAMASGIAAFQSADRARRPWIYLARPT